ncbi:MAG: type II/IV secretion system ATPase subunit, partial [Candidatus Diapherotrites archaeon]|nr:type II/IV secretion system ATPase subunit [Candidatus Diapherotrites archaeon]
MKCKIINCVGCDGFSSPTFPKCASKACPSDPKLSPLDEEIGLVVFKNNTFTKLWYVKEDEFVVMPFFVDVVIGPARGKTLKKYNVKDAEIRIKKNPEDVQPTYSIKIPHLDKSFKELWELYMEYENKNLRNELLQIWIKEKGILDYLLSDPYIQEVNMNPPEFSTPVRIVHAEFDECRTNIYPTLDFLNYLATFMKIETGRPLNKAQPQLDGELMVEKRKARVAAVRDPFSVYGLGYSIRVHRQDPWTVPLFMSNETVNEWFAGLMSLAITHGRTFLCSGPRGSGKTSLLGSLMLEILPKYRMITIEDTQELPIDAYKELGYDLLALKVRSALMEHGLEIPFHKGLRTSLRLGDSVLIIGEIRSKEATVLYEAMRVGAMSNVVAGTVHADNPYGVFDRVVNDLGVPRGSFKVTDLIVMVKQIKSPTALARVRRVTRVTEVLKDWEHEPKFQDL